MSGVLVPQGLFKFANLQDFISASFTLTQGIGPSSCVLEMAPYSGLFPKVGTLQITYGTLEILFPGAAVDKIELKGTGDGKVTWAVTILDRRWMWREFGKISGRYNANAEMSNKKQVSTDRTLEELIATCLEALGEDDAVIHQPLNSADLKPAVDWDYELPAKALAEVCEASNNIVTLGLDNRIHIYPKGYSETLPTINYIETQITVDPPEAPQKIVVVGLPDRWQFDFILDPVGKEIDGTIRPINELSYAPKVNNVVDWSENDPFFHNRVAVQSQNLAKESVWKWYRIRPGFQLPGFPRTGPGATPGVTGFVEKIEEVLPLLDEQVERFDVKQWVSNNGGLPLPDPDPKTIPRRPAWVYGKYSPIDDRIIPKGDIQPNLKNKPLSLYERSFSLDVQTGIVKFSDPVFQYSATKQGGGAAGGTGFYVYPADIRLRTSCNFNPLGWLGRQRTEYMHERTPGSSQASSNTFKPWTKYILADTIERETYFDPSTNSVKDTDLDCKELATKEWTVAVGDYLTGDNAQSTTYAGLARVACDGAVGQVTWAVDGQGFMTTRVSKNREELFVAPGYAERRMFEKLEQGLRRKK